MNTKFSYMYRDGANYKSFYDFVFEGEITEAQLERFEEVCEDEEFIPRAMGLSGGMFPGERGYDAEFDHYWCEHDFEDSFELVNDMPDVIIVNSKFVNIHINAFLEAWEKCCEQGWEASLYSPISLCKDFEPLGIEDATYVSFWDTGAIIEFPCKVNLDTKEVYDVEFDADVLDDFEVFQGEKVRLKDGTEYELFSKENLSKSKDGFWHEDSLYVNTQENEMSLAEKIQIAEEHNVDSNMIKISLSKDELNLIKQSLNEMGDKVADREGYSSGEKFWDLKEKIENLEKEHSQGVER